MWCRRVKNDIRSAFDVLAERTNVDHAKHVVIVTNLYINVVVGWRVRRCIGLRWPQRAHGLVDESGLEKILGIINIVLVPSCTQPRQGQH
jgi:hypothetical protein